MVRELWNDGWLGRTIIAIFLVAIAFVPLTIWAAIEDANQWSAFKEAHRCKMVGRMNATVAISTAPVIGGNGGVAVGTTYVPEKTGWLCDDGVTYWR